MESSRVLTTVDVIQWSTLSLVPRPPHPAFTYSTANLGVETRLEYSKVSKSNPYPCYQAIPRWVEGRRWKGRGWGGSGRGWRGGNGRGWRGGGVRGWRDGGEGGKAER